MFLSTESVTVAALKKQSHHRWRLITNSELIPFVTCAACGTPYKIAPLCNKTNGCHQIYCNLSDAAMNCSTNVITVSASGFVYCLKVVYLSVVHVGALKKGAA